MAAGCDEGLKLARKANCSSLLQESVAVAITMPSRTSARLDFDVLIKGLSSGRHRLVVKPVVRGGGVTGPAALDERGFHIPELVNRPSPDSACLFYQS